jgi:hypothetical protein
MYVLESKIFLILITDSTVPVVLSLLIEKGLSMVSKVPQSQMSKKYLPRAWSSLQIQNKVMEKNILHLH